MSIRHPPSAAIGALLFLAAAATARAGDVSFESGWIRAAPPGAAAVAAYGVFRNAAKQERIVVGASSTAFARVEFHATLPDGDVMRMRKVVDVPVPARGVTVFDPGGLHLMLMGGTPPAMGGKVGVTFRLADGSTFDATLDVREGPPDPHAHH